MEIFSSGEDLVIKVKKKKNLLIIINLTYFFQVEIVLVLSANLILSELLSCVNDRQGNHIQLPSNEKDGLRRSIAGS
jgi:hypothetical protein